MPIYSGRRPSPDTGPGKYGLSPDWLAYSWTAWGRCWMRCTWRPGPRYMHTRSTRHRVSSSAVRCTYSWQVFSSRRIFGLGERLFGSAEAPASPGAHLNKYQLLAIPGHDINLSIAGPVVGRQNAVSLILEEPAGQSLSPGAQPSARGRHLNRAPTGRPLLGPARRTGDGYCKGPAASDRPGAGPSDTLCFGRRSNPDTAGRPPASTGPWSL